MVLKTFLIFLMGIGTFSAQGKSTQLQVEIGKAKFLIERMQYHFDYKTRALRPKSCPLESKKMANIASALGNLKSALDNDCTSKNQALISGLNESIGGINTAYKTEVESGKRFEGMSSEDKMYQAQQNKIEMVSKSLSANPLNP